MLASMFNEPGGPEVLYVGELPVPVPGPGEVLVRVLAAGIQPADTAVRSGWSPPGAEITYPAVPGNEFAGVVEQLGPGSFGWEVGDEVLGFRLLNCHAQHVAVDGAQLVPKPAGMSWAEAGSFSASAQTAHVALTELKVGRGDTVLIHGASGGVGTVAVQLARAWGATVIGTASERNHAYLRELGAIPVTYGEGLADRVRELAPDGVDAALDAAGRGALEVSVELVPDQARIGTIVDYAGAQRLGLTALRGPRTAARLAELTEVWESGALRLEIAATFPLARAAEAHRLVEDGHVRGKAVITPWAD
ncbi:NADPH:quinone reductase-like Zn-dependent oxidoreductase [Kitasatospora gansuensis]|uniref:NADPH:quinone reductase-like Zn-dependent oxidoreductase n=1 Tax=Kitasatospora gansuensis TaxID=258050 RepID=A0A7W7SEV8_9ACTN|nr:NADP-dependent oxidoreductase [Kitasatospora gansuensis]MBB4949175.1 NADPH:quinone reductase-like Zn-dependent oxidoreductase [Kitasatospora gansuensis]